MSWLGPLPDVTDDLLIPQRSSGNRESVRGWPLWRLCSTSRGNGRTAARDDAAVEIGRVAGDRREPSPSTCCAGPLSAANGPAQRRRRLSHPRRKTCWPAIAAFEAYDIDRLVG